MTFKTTDTPFGKISANARLVALHTKAPVFVIISGAEINNFLLSLFVTVAIILLSYYIYKKESISRFLSWAKPNYKTWYLVLLFVALVFGILIHFSIYYGLGYLVVGLFIVSKLHISANSVLEDLINNKIDFSKFEGWEHTKLNKNAGDTA